jgi:hypothetical protein
LAAYFPDCAAATARTTPSKVADIASLRRQILEFRIDKQGAPYPFSMRLADEQDWSIEFAQQAIEEYKRFIFLAAVCDHPVTPSFVVDEVWHTHLIFTRSYWEELGDVVGKLIHHDPGQGEPGDETVFANQYLKTLESYRKHFGEPPVAVWGPENRKNVIAKGRKAL